MIAAVKNHFGQWWRAWDRFWFTPMLPDTLCWIRIATGGMLFYCHLVWAMHETEFLGNHAWMSNATIRQLHQHDGAWSYLWHIEQPWLLSVHHFAMLVLAGCLAVGLGTRLVAPVAFFLHLMYLHRLTGALFGLDQVLTMLLMYLTLAPSNARWSLDAWWWKQAKASATTSSSVRPWWLGSLQPSTSATISTRLIQLHLCVIYLFGGISKMRGDMWWDGSAMWFAVANFEYQSVDLTWLGHYPRLFATLCGLTLVWETFYPALVWPRLTRPYVLAMAVLVHGGIALALGMITFGTMMIVANSAFLPPTLLRRGSRTITMDHCGTAST